MSFNKVTTEAALRKALAENKSAVVVFGAEWSPISKVTKQTFEKNLGKYSSTHFVWIDIDEAPPLQKAYTIEAIPTTLGYKGKSEVNKYIGPMNTDSQLDTFVKKTL
ncbi:thioredoxin-like protein [Boeremia exigua]|uniref:thioredoxin-like protein n=1 Tax=Boeremia exigua TaxID=749465 RepID=UPI001E8D4109|nr:thioredoxin-like protein [Boeremia exigua]KAH6615205.1 thioredoxin-like protein [Boeremia exigua]